MTMTRQRIRRAAARPDRVRHTGNDGFAWRPNRQLREAACSERKLLEGDIVERVLALHDGAER